MVPIVFNEKCLKYSSEGHPETPYRVEKTYEFLKSNDYNFVRHGKCSIKDIKLCHTQKLIDSVKSGNFFNADTPNLPHIFEYAKLSAGGALKALDLTKNEKVVFTLIRPPGHHAKKDELGGFCYFNNIAIMVKKSGRKCAIIDIDCHHGNGTQDIFLGEKGIMYFSIHRNGFFYPGTGTKSIKNCINYPIHSLNLSDWMKSLNSIISKVKNFSPDLIAVSAGFDAYKEDPIGGLGLKIESFKTIGEKIGKLSIPTVCLLEGGYSKELPLCIHNFLTGIQ